MRMCLLVSRKNPPRKKSPRKKFPHPKFFPFNFVILWVAFFLVLGGGGEEGGQKTRTNSI